MQYIRTQSVKALKLYYWDEYSLKLSFLDQEKVFQAF